MDSTLNPRIHLPNSSWKNNKISWFGYKFSDGLYLPTAGYGSAYFGTGSLAYRGFYGGYWSTRMEDPERAYSLNFYSYNMYMDSAGSNHGFSIRCIVK
jgi:hypothetical protein